MSAFDEAEFFELCRRFNSEPHLREEVIEYSSCSYFNRLRNLAEGDRRGEAVFCVIRPNSRVVVVTCEDYPDGVFRVPTGGIRYGEDITEAVLRETREELGLDAEIIRFAGVIKICFKCKDESFMFHSYLFILRETGGRLLIDAADDEVSGVKEADIKELEEMVESLGSITGEWSDWGKFRHLTSRAVLDYLREHALIG